ncbi:recombinase family protein [Gluconobacter cerinus]|uniref:recombinase family protein n=1 Tax=Gluconobacter cerinus TaxID=38307 RepID=UPI002013AA99|nr:recombinase family protein [Gluconobacter cerinus]
MVRVALYARYSSDNQRAASIEDQFRICREHAKREKWKVVSAYKDAGISGSSMILRPDLEERVLAGLKHKLMTPEAAAAAMKAYTEETNRLNHERRANSAGWKAELAKVEKGIAGIMTAIENGMFDLHMKARMQELRDREVDLNALLSSELEDTLDIHPNVAAIFKKKVARLTESLNQPEDRAEASEAVRALVEKIVLSPGDKRGDIFATLYGELGTLLRFVNQRDTKSGKSLKRLAKKSMWESVVAGVGFEPTAFRL